MQLLKGTEYIRFTDGWNIITFKVSVPLVTGLSVHQTQHSGLLHQVPPYAAIEITGNSFHCRFWFLHQPAAAAKILLHAPVQGGFTADASGQRRYFCNPLSHGSDLFKCSVASGDDTFNAGGANHIGMVS
ncbi:Uncharacterised protein [Salmonella enterica subsp. enterica serovar Bovismorbificans]|uniref:Uncharacterized protein n=1 Tax=Salmonella enterica subsp. enterica serovar Bovismorbificans TaxID=58097 RepID=A0A655E1D1_SALET|nr:Uncharacterised protein [Salmonella enterica subsp. enterica serovar Bovismorbificans]CNU95326.1 Uncharacterised protein [Salmonella enterica subsp. enterica serovar Bovismorbificans]CNV25635.1 Uncharacterised protein [Salmonella enterica subsp. enterica serovar Bovismorbificans]